MPIHDIGELTSRWVGRDHGKRLTSSNQNTDLLTNSRISVVKIATEVQTDEVTSLYKTKHWVSNGRRGFGRNKFTLDLYNGILKVHPSKKMMRELREETNFSQDKAWKSQDAIYSWEMEVGMLESVRQEWTTTSGKPLAIEWTLTRYNWMIWQISRAARTGTGAMENLWEIFMSLIQSFPLMQNSKHFTL